MLSYLLYLQKTSVVFFTSTGFFLYGACFYTIYQMDSEYSAWSEWEKKDFWINSAHPSAMLYIFKVGKCLADLRVLQKVTRWKLNNDLTYKTLMYYNESPSSLFLQTCVFFDTTAVQCSSYIQYCLYINLLE